MCGRMDGSPGRGWRERLPCFGKEHHLLAVSGTAFPQASGLNSKSTLDAHQAGKSPGSLRGGGCGPWGCQAGHSFPLHSGLCLSPGCLARPLSAASALCCSAQSRFPGSHPPEAAVQASSPGHSPQPPNLFLLPTPCVRGFLSHICAPGALAQHSRCPS